MGRGQDSQLLEAESLGKSLTGSHMLFPIFFPGVSIQLFIFKVLLWGSVCDVGVHVCGGQRLTSCR